MVAGMAVIGCIDNVIAPMSEEIGLAQFFVIRTVMAAPLVALCAWFGLGTLRPKRLWAVATRCGLLGASMVFYFGALSVVTLPQALAGLFTSPLFILIFSYVLLGQTVGPFRIGAVLLGFLGITLVIAPWEGDLSIYLIMPVFGGVLYALGALATRTLCAGESVLAMLLGTFLAQALLGVVSLAIFTDPAGDFVGRGWVWPVPLEVWGYLLAQSFGAVIGVGLLIRAYALGDASYVTVFEYSVFVFGAFFAWVFFGQLLGMAAILGIALIAVAGIVIALRS